VARTYDQCVCHLVEAGLLATCEGEGEVTTAVILALHLRELPEIVVAVVNSGKVNERR
jgi:hypothetical protein